MRSAIREQLPQIEVAVADNATALVLRVLAAPAPEDLALLRAFAHAHAVRFYLQTGGIESVVPLDAGRAARCTTAWPSSI